MSDDSTTALVRTHLRWGWALVLLGVALGTILETLHGFKVPYYVDVANEARQTMWRLAHAHGTLLGLVHVAFAATLPLAAGWPEAGRRLASRLLVASGVLLPAGFLLGGLVIRAGDPGFGILLVPLGAVLLIGAMLLTFRGSGAN